MAKVLGIHQLELKPDVSEEAFEQFFWHEFCAAKTPGVKDRLLKGDKGERNGKYLLIFEFERPGDREQFFVDEANQSDAVKQAWAMWQKLQQYVMTDEWTDYVEHNG